MAPTVSFYNSSVRDSTEKGVTSVDLSGLGVIPQKAKMFHSATTQSALVQGSGGPFSLKPQNDCTFRNTAVIIKSRKSLRPNSDRSVGANS